MLTPESEAVLSTVHPDLIAVVRKAATITKIPFAVIRGRMDAKEIDALIADGLGKLGSYGRNYSGHAINIMPVAAHDPHGLMPFGPCYSAVADAMCLAAADLAIPVDWGGWRERDRDDSLFELRKGEYPTTWETGPFRA